MKLAIFFIIVGISSCFVDADHVQDCQQKMNQGQAQNIVAHLIQVLTLLHKIKDITDECGIRSCWESIIFLIKLIAAATNCPYDAMCWTVVTNLPQSHSAQAKEIQPALSAGNLEGLIKLNLEVTVLADTVTHTVRILATIHGHNADDLATGTVMSLAGTTPEIPKVLASLKSCGLCLGIVASTVGGVISLVSEAGSTIVCGGGLGETAINNLTPLLNNLLGDVAHNALSFINNALGGALDKLTGTASGLLGGKAEGLGGLFGKLLGGGGGALNFLNDLLGGLTGGTGGVLR